MYLYLGDEEVIYNMLPEAKILKKNSNKADNLKNKIINTSVLKKKKNNSGTFPTKLMVRKSVSHARGKG